MDAATSVHNEFSQGSYTHTVIASVLIAIMSLVMKRLTEFEFSWMFLSNLEEYFTNKHSLILEGEKIRSIPPWGGTHVSILFTPRFNAIWTHIAENIMDNNMIRCMKEVLKSESSGPTAEQNIFVVNQSRSFMVDSTCQIYATVGIDNNNDNNEKTGASHNRTKYTITLFSRKVSIKKIIEFIDNITEKYVASIVSLRGNKKYIYTLETVHYTEDILSCWSEHEFKSNFTFDRIFFNGKDEMLNKLDFFLQNKEWYTELGIPYTLGIGLHGPPGTGKTSLIKCIANYTGRHLIVLSLKLIKTRKQLFSFFFEHFYNTKNTNPIEFDNKIIVLEDLDCCTDIIFRRQEQSSVLPKPITRKSVEHFNVDNITEMLLRTDDDIKKPTVTNVKDDPITLDDILNLWDGIRETPGRLMIITSNHYEKLDPALIRPGRIDITMELTNANRKVIGDMYKHLFHKQLPARVLSKMTEYVHSPASIMNKYISCQHNSDEFIQSLLHH
jgi:AAA+ superfamily predicted ATPase